MARDARVERAVVDRRDVQAAADEQRGPAAGRGAEVDGGLAFVQQLVRAVAEEHRDRLGELVRGARGQAARDADARNAERPGRAGGRVRRADVAAAAVVEEHVRLARLPSLRMASAVRGIEFRALAQRAREPRVERARERRERLALVRVGVLDPRIVPRRRVRRVGGERDERLDERGRPGRDASRSARRAARDRCRPGGCGRRRAGTASRARCQRPASQSASVATTRALPALDARLRVRTRERGEAREVAGGLGLEAGAAERDRDRHRSPGGRGGGRQAFSDSACGSCAGTVSDVGVRRVVRGGHRHGRRIGRGGARRDAS